MSEKQTDFASSSRVNMGVSRLVLKVPVVRAVAAGVSCFRSAVSQSSSQPAPRVTSFAPSVSGKRHPVVKII
jgi:hypothetical protein